MRALWRVFGRVCLAAAAGVAMGAAFPDASIWPLAVVALVLMLGLVSAVRVGAALLYGVVFGAVFWLPHLSWAIISAGGGYLPWVALSMIQSLAWGMWAGSASAVSHLPGARRPWVYVLAMGAVWVGVEQLRARVPFSGFPWGNLAYPHVDAPIGHLAPVGGEALVSFAVMAVAALLWVALAPGERFESGVDRWWSRPLCAALAFCVYFLPVIWPLSADQQEGAVSIGAVQGGVEVPGGQTYAIEGKVTGNHAAQTALLVQQGRPVDLIVWGEGALDRDPRSSSVVAQQVRDSVALAGVPILVGFNKFVSERSVIHNVYAPWYPDSGLAQTMYGKQIPVPFGEYIPFRDFISSLATEAAQVRVDMEGVVNSARMDVALNDGRQLPVGTGICFEVAYESLWAEAIRSGSQLLVSPSNNYHFRDSAEPAQQAQMARFRAMEFGRSMVQVSTTGESMLIRPDGGVLAQTPRHTAAFLSGSLPLRTSVTPAVYTAVPLAFVCMFLWAGACVFSIYHRFSVARASAPQVRAKRSQSRKKLI